ncbi:RraA family protein [Bhargavaea beijingensis]|uniref:Putative 4-hydroxy-4-methyl-2-oxoglutarate aldolase n=1 Tax=Bhargavaea beijingensis TaxID=426756 RepID=A0ABX9ZD95_9BACL|nr:RraA family protein [Bhargavaea beijingensis]RSK32631.1 RraA family protein [Bhargavaea beijingensis]
MTDEVIARFAPIPTTAISDATGGMNNMDAALKPLRQDYRIAGRAVTVKLPGGDNPAMLRAMRTASPGDVLVVDAKGDLTKAVAGDFVVGMMKTLGLAGLVVDGAVRDVHDIRALGFPVFVRGTTVAASSKTGEGEVNVPISCGGAAVRPGDLVVGDADGVTIIPREQEQAVLQKALAKLEKDEAREREVAGDIDAVRRYLDMMASK